jgi:hypothetical protein
VFASFAVLAVVVAVLGLGRVWLSVQAAEASRAATALRHDLKAERYEGDMLEIRQSALGSPSRIRGIAGATMSMKPARRVTYVRLGSASPRTAAAPVRQTHGSEFQRVVAGMMDLTAGEAQVLLVGNVGLGSQK